MIARRKPLKRTAIKRGRKRSSYSKRKRNFPYMEFVRSLPCAIPGCANWDIEAAHVGPRAFGCKSADEETIPLCREHHRTGKDAHHVLGRKFEAHHGIDFQELIGRLNHCYDLQNGKETP